MMDDGGYDITIKCDNNEPDQIHHATPKMVATVMPEIGDYWVDYECGPAVRKQDKFELNFEEDEIDG